MLDPADLDPWSFSELAGTVRVAAAGTDLVTVSGLLETPDGVGLLITTMTISPHDLGTFPDPERARAALAAEGARSDGVPLEVAALLRSVDGAGAPAVGVGIVRPLVLAHPAAFPHEADPTAWPTAIRDAVAEAVAEDREVVADLGGRPLDPLPGPTARIWSPMFAVARAATVGLAARSAG